MFTIIKHRLFFGASALILGLFFIGAYLKKDKINTRSDLVEIAANLDNYSFNEYRGYRYHTYHYYLYFHGYRNRFQIIADFVWLFKKKSFEQDIDSHDILHIYVSKKDYKNINNQFNIRLFGINKNGFDYLNVTESIKKYNNGTEIYAGTIFIIVGALLFYFNRSKFK
jgi:hypothetical protein